MEQPNPLEGAKPVVPTAIEYRVRPVTRFIVTRHYASDDSCGTSPIGEFDNEQLAYNAGYALCRTEHQQLGWPLDDSRIKYPAPPAPTPAERSDAAQRAQRLQRGLRGPSKQFT